MHAGKRVKRCKKGQIGSRQESLYLNMGGVD